MKRFPIRARLAVWYTIVLSLGLVLFSLAVWMALNHILRSDLTQRVANEAAGLAEYLQIEDEDPEFQFVREISEYSKSLHEDHLLSTYTESGKLLYKNFGGDGEALKPSGKPRPHQILWQQRHYLTTSEQVLLKRGPVRVSLAISSESIERPLRLLGWLLASIVPIFVICAAVGGYWLSRRALLPVDRITERARNIGVNNLSERLAVPETRDELQRLTETWNDMLSRIETAFAKVSQFTADASHELRTPVAIIRLAAENALRKRRSESEYRVALESIQRESQSMTRLIENLLFLARVGVDSSSGDMQEVELQPLIDDACSDFSPLAWQKNIALTQELPQGAVKIRGNCPALRRVLFILLDNAIKYTPAGGRVCVHLEQVQEQAIVRVEDTGVGIPEEARSRVFQRFFRVDPSRSRQSGGYGLGLAIAQSIAQQHEALIEVESKSSGGCIFSVSLPLVA